MQLLLTMAIAPVLDSFDRAILALLQQDNTLPQRQIAEAVHLSTPAVQRRIKRLQDSGAVLVGSLLGTSNTTSYIESAAGVEAGGRTGLVAVVVVLVAAAVVVVCHRERLHAHHHRAVVVLLLPEDRRVGLK